MTITLLYDRSIMAGIKSVAKRDFFDLWLFLKNNWKSKNRVCYNNIVEAYREYIEAWKRRALIEEREMEYWRKKALLKAKRAAKFLAKRYKVKKVVLFGSVIRGMYRRDSDIDLAVAGLPKILFLKVSVEVEELIKIPVDLKLIEEVRGLFAKRIEEGITLYEKKS